MGEERSRRYNQTRSMAFSSGEEVRRTFEARGRHASRRDTCLHGGAAHAGQDQGAAGIALGTDAVGSIRPSRTSATDPAGLADARFVQEPHLEALSLGMIEPKARVADAIVVPVFGYKNHLEIDHRHGFIRRFVVTDAAAHDGRQLGRLLDPDNTASGVWAHPAYRSAANVALLARRGLVPQFQRPKPRGRRMPSQIARGNATRARVRVAIEHVFAAQKCRLGLVIRTVGLARATARLGLANLVTNLGRLAWFETRPRPA